MFPESRAAAPLVAVIAFGALGCSTAAPPASLDGPAMVPASDRPSRPMDLASCLVQGEAGSDAGEAPRRYEKGDTELIGDIGLTGGPSMFLLGGEMSYHLDEASAVGALLQLGVSGDDTFLGLSMHYKHHFYLEGAGARSRLRPFAQGGLGFAYLDKDRRDDWSVLVHAGGGLQYHVNSTTHLGSNILLDFLPNEPAGDSFVFTWQVLQVGFRF